MTTILERVPVERISTEAREVHIGRTLLTIIAAFFFAIGWSAARVFLAVAWCGVAVRLGWQEARSGGTRRPAG